MQTRHRAWSLDVLRAVAVLLVLGRHLQPFWPEQSALWRQVSDLLWQGGWVGVDLFFVLSGFLVGGLLFKEHRESGRIALGRFLLRRGFKIYPQFWLFTGFIIAWKLASGEAVSGRQCVAELFFFQNYTPGVWGTNWSLAVEEHFYLLLPVLLVALHSAAGERVRADAFTRLPWIVGAVALGCLGLRALAAARAPFEVITHLTPTHLRIDALFFGVLAAYFYQHRREAVLAFCRRHHAALLAGGVAAFLPAFWLELGESWFLQVPGLTLHALGGVALLGAALSWQGPGNACTRALAAIGRHSYAIYLWHLWIGLHGLRLLYDALGFRPVGPTHAAIFVLVSIGAGALLTHAFETPLLALRDRFFPGHGARQTGAISGCASPAA